MTENDNVPGTGSDAPGPQEPTSVYPVGYQPYGSTQHYQPVTPPSYGAQPYPGQYGYGGQTYGHAYGQQAAGPGFSGYGSQPGYAQEVVGSTGPGTEAEVEPTQPTRGRALVVASVIAALIGGGVGGGIVAAADRHNNGTVNTGLKITNSTGAPAAQTNGTIGAAAQKIRPSVVTIDVSAQTESGTGSGVIIRTDGYILTNNHVVAIGSSGGQLGEIEVTLADGRTAPGKVIGQDASDDLAVVKVDGLSDLTAATFAKSSEPTVGQAVVAVGAPLGLSDTVTAGIVSNTARPVRTGQDTTTPNGRTNPGAVFQAIQTDAAINPGNSGGPLVDLNGSVVGINSAIASDTSGQSGEAGNIGIGFAIPSDEASRIASELIAQGKAYHAVIGISVVDSTSKVNGVLVKDVSSGGGAANAGIRSGDVITSINDGKVRTADALIAAVRSHAPGEQVKITFTRGSASQTVTVTLGKSDS